MIQVGQVLDKYELLERVGQGGMAVVYRGLDRSLKRTVAIKVLHKHLADYQEARDRFEREAQAVAKLRHENILEIFDYAAKEGSECYIVTEFIDGQTLKQFFTDRPIAFPELGAMIMLQVCRALAHAHAGGILHRDVKPENIMIRSDGIVKLMDFGISHMVDLERLTVTGQLLGSPAYMAPEHVEGRPIDFRTDVFAAGIVLYQLTVGKLPFEGKNPHEVLKRIAECKYVDPRQANPRIGNRLGKIILRAMAAQPNDRYPGIGEMVIALEGYLEESGLQPDKIPSELARYFQAPVPYEQALKDRLVDVLTRRGLALLGEDNQAGALDAFDRVLTIDPQNAKVLEILDRLNRRAKLRTAALAVGVACVLAGGGYMVHRRMQPPPPSAMTEMPIVAMTNDRPDTHVVAVESPPVEIDAGVVAAAADAGMVVVAVPRDAGALALAKPDAPSSEAPIAIEIKTFSGSRYRTDEGPWQPVAGDTFVVTVADRPITVGIQNPCCQETAFPVSRDTQPGRLVALEFKPIQVTPICDTPGVSVSVENRAWKVSTTATRLDPFTITYEKHSTISIKKARVVFTTADGRVDPHEVAGKAGEQLEVRCAF